jgi:hypothetical protein
MILVLVCILAVMLTTVLVDRDVSGTRGTSKAPLC